MALTIKEAKHRVPLVDLFKFFGVTDIVPTGQNYKCKCPFHRERTASMRIYTNSKRFHCFGCGITGDAVSLVIAFRPHLTKMAISPHAAALQYLAKWLNMPAEQRRYKKYDPPKIEAGPHGNCNDYSSDEEVNEADRFIPRIVCHEDDILPQIDDLKSRYPRYTDEELEDFFFGNSSM